MSPFNCQFEQNDPRPIGVFDSGLGGLTAVRALDALLPGEDIVYFGDTARLPYGTRSRGIIFKYLRQDIAFLRTFDVKLLVVACGTASTACLPELNAEYPFPLLGVVEPSVKMAVAVTRSKRIGLIATAATVASGVYEAAAKDMDPGVTVTAQACPLLVPLVENGRGKRGDAVAEIVIREYLQPLINAGVDTLILGCTHYPLLTDIIRVIMGDGVALIDSGEAVARAAAERLAGGERVPTFSKGGAPEGRGGVAPFAPPAACAASPSKRGGQERGARRYFVSDCPDGYALNAALFLGRALESPVQKVDIEAFA